MLFFVVVPASPLACWNHVCLTPSITAPPPSVRFHAKPHLIYDSIRTTISFCDSMRNLIAFMIPCKTPFHSSSGRVCSAPPISKSSPLNLYFSTLNPQPSDLSPQPSTLNSQPSSINPQPSTLNPQPSTLNPPRWLGLARVAPDRLAALTLNPEP